MKKVLFPSGYRSEKVLSDPIRRRLAECKNIEIIYFDLEPGKYLPGYIKTSEIIDELNPDFAAICADRAEMAGSAAACFNKGVPFAHIYAGIGNNIGTTDDVNRHVMTLQSVIQFCEGPIAAGRVKQLRCSIGLPCDKIHAVGVTHMDDAEIEPWGVPAGRYDVVAYNPPATHLKSADQQGIIRKEWETILKHTEGADTVLALFPAPDTGVEHVREMLDTMKCRGWVIIPSLDRARYFYALRNCRKFISNSSATYYEAPLLMNPQNIVKVGLRNSGRDEGPFESGASDRIVEILREYLK